MESKTSEVVLPLCYRYDPAFGTFDRFSGLSSTEGPVINEAGQVVFLAILADGRRGIFVAEPTTIPTQIP